MIEVVRSHLAELRADAVLRSVAATLDADTPFSREVEILAGPEVTERLQAMGELPVGAGVITPAGNLETPFLIHVVVQSNEEPVTSDGVKAALTNGLRRAEEWGLESLVLPPLGTGAGNLDMESSAAVMVPVLMNHMALAEYPKSVMIAVSNSFEQDVFSRLIVAEPGPPSSGIH